MKKSMRIKKKHEARFNKSVKLFIDMNGNDIIFKAKAVSTSNTRKLLRYAKENGYDVDIDLHLIDDRRYKFCVYENEDGTRRTAPKLEHKRAQRCDISRNSL